MERVFVYGSLKHGFNNHAVLHDSGCEFISDDRLPAGLFSMVDLGAFPGLVPDENGGEIWGEVYDVQTMRYLDRLEGYPTFYDRRVVYTDDNNACWVYFLRSPHRGTIITSGNWRENYAVRH